MGQCFLFFYARSLFVLFAEPGRPRQNAYPATCLGDPIPPVSFFRAHDIQERKDQESNTLDQLNKPTIPSHSISEIQSGCDNQKQGGSSIKRPAFSIDSILLDTLKTSHLNKDAK